MQASSDIVIGARRLYYFVKTVRNVKTLALLKPAQIINIKYGQHILVQGNAGGSVGIFWNRCFLSSPAVIGTKLGPAANLGLFVWAVLGLKIRGHRRLKKYICMYERSKTMGSGPIFLDSTCILSPLAWL